MPVFGWSLVVSEMKSAKNQRNSTVFLFVIRIFCVLSGLLMTGLFEAGAQTVVLPSAAKRRVDFVKDIQPVFVEHCLSCHGPDKQKNAFRVDVREIVLKGGDTHGVAIVPGKSAESPLIHYVAGTDEEMLMPPKGKRLTPEQVGLLRAWIDQGAIWPDSASVKVESAAAKHWAYQPLQKPEVPKVPGMQRNPIDAFIGQKLAEKGLQLSPEADRRTLIRRLYFILHGLPPTPDDVAAFLADKRPDAYEQLVDKLLASPRYGERWGRHWLDVIPFGETHGFEVNTPRENAWPYRDYVIRAFNEDIPYPRFIQEQLAGDAVGVDPATGFLVAAAALLPGQVGKDEESKLRARQDELSDMVAGVGGAFLGLTLHCARCHDHKFDPVTQVDYYSIQAVFAGVRHGERPVRPPDWEERQQEMPVIQAGLAVAAQRLYGFEPLASVESQPKSLRPAVHPQVNSERFIPQMATRVRFTILATSENNRYEPCIDELEIYTAGPERRNVALASAGAKATSSSNRSTAGKHHLVKLNDGLYSDDHGWISKTKGTGWVEVEFAQPERIDLVVWGRDRTLRHRDRLAIDYRIEVAQGTNDWKLVAGSMDREPWADEKAKRDKEEPAGLNDAQRAEYRAALVEKETWERKLRALTNLPQVYAGRFEQPSPIQRLQRGDVTQPREEVGPAAVAALGLPLKLSGDEPERERRSAFARWLTEEQNPLPARVMVNRLWQHHFGEGIVSTPSDFGLNGAKPSHPELLDWLASEFREQGGSVKHMQRLIVLSATWRQASAPNPKAQTVDAAGRLLWRFPPRRLEAEPIRDAMLAVAGTLDLRMGGPGFSVFAPNNNYVRVYDPKQEYGPAEWRRMVYQTKVRMAQDSTFGAFDCPDAGQASPKRSRSTTPLQALNLFNSGFVLQQAELFAKRLQKEAGDQPKGQVRRGFQLVFNREPEPDEVSTCETLIKEHGLATFCRVLLNADEFLFIP